MILIGPGILAIVYPQVGKLAGLLGALGGCLVIYLLPTITFLAQKRTEINNPDLVKALRKNTYAIKPALNIMHSPKIGIPMDHEDIVELRQNKYKSRQNQFVICLLIGLVIAVYGFYVCYVSIF